jgi:hypothetical protein
MSYENNIQKENEIEQEKYRRINSIDDNNPWIQDSTTMSDIDKQSSKLAEHYIENHLRSDPNGGKSSNTIKRELAAFYQTTDPTLVRYTLRKMAHSPKSYSAITDFAKSDEYYISYNVFNCYYKLIRKLLFYISNDFFN